MIPSNYHHIWIDRQNRPELTGLPEDILLNLRTWQASQLGFKEVFWLLPELLRLTRKYRRPDVAAAIATCRYPAAQADIGRLFILLIFGGFWIDLKLYPLRAFLKELISYDLVLIEHFVKPDLPDPTGVLSNSFIGARPNHPTIALALSMAVCNVLRRSNDNIYATTGAPNIMKALDQTRGLWGAYRLLKYNEAWANSFDLRGGTYNSNEMHWSQRQQRGENLYVDEIDPTITFPD